MADKKESFAKRSGTLIPEKFTRMPEECLHWIRITGEDLAKAEALWKYEEENRKTVLASLNIFRVC
jgi:hypothetical protein